MQIILDNQDKDDGMVTVYCEDQQAAIEDQTIEGSRWEAPGDMDVAYAIIIDRPGLVADLEADGYEVNDDDYSPEILTVYVVDSSGGDGTPPEGLYGDCGIAFPDANEANIVADDLRQRAVWGRDGDLTASEIGISYNVRAVNPCVEDGVLGWAAKACARSGLAADLLDAYDLMRREDLPE